jgi:hypothetical protein
MCHAHTEALRSTLGDEVITTTPHANQAEWINLTADRGAWRRLSANWLNRQQRHTKNQYGHHPKLGVPVEKLPRADQKSRLCETGPLSHEICPNLETQIPCLNEIPYTQEQACQSYDLVQPDAP